MFSGVALGNQTESLFNVYPCVAEGKRSNTNTAKEPKSPDVDWRMEERTVCCFLSGTAEAHHRTCVRCRSCSCATGAAARAATMDKGHERYRRKVACAFITPNVPKADSGASWEVPKARREGSAGQGGREKKDGSDWTRRIYRRRVEKEQTRTERGSNGARNSLWIRR